MAVTTPNPIDAGSGATVGAPFPEAPVIPISPWGDARPHVVDRVLRWLAKGSGLLIVAVIGGIGGFLLLRAIPALKRNRENFLPTAGVSGIITGIMLAVARVMGETAPLLVLVGYSQSMNFDIVSGFMGTLPGMMYNQTGAGTTVNPVPTDRLWGAALTLILVIATINIGARVTAKFLGAKKS
jgi:ABC-type phosphate transport system permease subunit